MPVTGHFTTRRTRQPVMEQNEMDRRRVLESLESHEWPYASNDMSGAVREMAERIARTGRMQVLISYSNLVAGITFRFSNVRNGAPFVIDAHNWEGLHRRIVGDSLGYISYLPYSDYDFMASALVAGLVENRPSEIYFEWMEFLGALPNTTDAVVDRSWTDQEWMLSRLLRTRLAY
jgi:hypothetical protein